MIYRGRSTRDGIVDVYSAVWKKRWDICGVYRFHCFVQLINLERRNCLFHFPQSTPLMTNSNQEIADYFFARQSGLNGLNDAQGIFKQEITTCSSNGKCFPLYLAYLFYNHRHYLLTSCLVDTLKAKFTYRKKNLNTPLKYFRC